ncbi:MAG: PKD domain-containing protein [Candidatus Bathyarchaeia archaeon]
MDPATLLVSEGSVFNITVKLENMPQDPGIVGLQFKISWDSNILKAINMEEVLFHACTPESEQSNIWALSHTVTDGYVEYAYTWMNLTRALEKGYAPISGNQTIAVVTLNATATGYATLTFSLLKIGSWDPIQKKTVYVVDYPKKPLPANYNLIESTVTVGNPPPTIVILSPTNIIYNNVPINLIFTLSKETVWISYVLDGQANVTIDGNTTISPPDGSHYIIVYANDTVGQIGSSSPIYFTVDTTPPIASFENVINAGIIFGTYKWNVTFNASASYDVTTEIVDYYWDFGDGFTGKGTIVTHLYRNPGTYNVTLTVKDQANHTSTTTKVITLAEPPEPLSVDWWIITIILIPLVWAGVFVYLLKKKFKK